MSKKNKKQSRTPKPSEILGKHTGEEEAEEEEEEATGVPTPEAVFETTAQRLAETPVAETPKYQPAENPTPPVETPKEQPSLADIVANLPEEIREKAQEQLGKLMAQATRNESAKQLAEFNNTLLDAEKGIAKWLEDLAETHKVSLAGRKITIAYPKVEEEAKTPTVSNVPKGKKDNIGNGDRKDFPGGWGEAELIKEGKVIQKEKSPCALAKSMGLQITGKRDMPDVWNNPQEAGTKAELPKIYKVDAVKGEYFRVTIIS